MFFNNSGDCKELIKEMFYPRATITKEKPEPIKKNFFIEKAKQLGNAAAAMENTYAVVSQITKYGHNAFHAFLDKKYNEVPLDEPLIVKLDLLVPETKIFQTVWGIGDLVVIEELRKIPRVETEDPCFFKERHNMPKIHGGRSFNTVLEAIGMGILTAEFRTHQKFISKMFEILNIPTIDQTKEQTTYSPLKKRFIQIANAEISNISTIIEESINQKTPCSLDFRKMALKIFLKSWYPNLQETIQHKTEEWDNWIEGFSKEIEYVSDLAFKAIMNNTSNTSQLRNIANQRLSPFIDTIMEQDQSDYLGETYTKESGTKIQRQIITSLIFAAADNIKKYLDHVCVELGNDEVQKNELHGIVAETDIKRIRKETARCFTTIYAQPGVAEEDFYIHYKGRIYEIKKGDILHYTTWRANTDPRLWGENAGKFNSKEHEAYYEYLNPETTYGSTKRRCKGQLISNAIIEGIMKMAINNYRWKAFVNGRENYHPTIKNFNNGVDGAITYLFKRVN